MALPAIKLMQALCWQILTEKDGKKVAFMGYWWLSFSQRQQFSDNPVFIYKFLRFKNMFEELTEALSIKFSRSEDGSQFDFQSSPDKDKYSTKLKCFRCFGTHQLNCQECHGTEMISYNHPMARLLDEVLVRKLNLSRKEEEREEQLERVYPIKEEEEDSEERKNVCNFCEKQCQISSYYSQQSSNYTCSECTGKTSLHHRKINKNIGINNYQRERYDQKHCQNCNCQIQNCYSTCKTCLALDHNYWICGACSDSQSYTHPACHVFEAAFNSAINRLARIQLGSQIDIEESCQNSETYQDQELLEQVDMLVINRTSSITTDIRPEQSNNGFGDQTELNRKSLVASCVKLQIDGLFNSCEGRCQLRSIAPRNKNLLNSQNHSEKKQIVSLGRISKDQKQNIFSSKASEEKVNYIFQDYKCDLCGREPITNIRYHCRQCEDYDVCQACYPVCKLHHEHCFDKIDGKLIREQAILKLFESNMMQSCNKLKRGGSCHEPLNVRQAFAVI